MNVVLHKHLFGFKQRRRKQHMMFWLSTSIECNLKRCSSLSAVFPCATVEPKYRVNDLILLVCPRRFYAAIERKLVNTIGGKMYFSSFLVPNCLECGVYHLFLKILLNNVMYFEYFSNNLYRTNEIIFIISSSWWQKFVKLIFSFKEIAQSKLYLQWPGLIKTKIVHTD